MIDTIAAIVSAIPLTAADRFRAVEIGATTSAFAGAFAAAFPSASLLSLEQAEGAAALPVQREPASPELVRRPFDIASVEWWDVVAGAAVMVAPNGLASLNEAKKQYLFRAAADRLTAPAAIVVADALEAGTLLHHLVWLKHAGLTMVDCFAREGATAVFGGYRR